MDSKEGKTETTKLKHRIYRFVDEQGKPIKIKDGDKAVAYVNDKITETTVEQLFEKIYNIDDKRISGHSFLQELILVNKIITKTEEEEGGDTVKFYDPKTKKVFCLKLDIPIIIYDDEIVDDEKMGEFSALLLINEIKEELEKRKAKKDKKEEEENLLKEEKELKKEIKVEVEKETEEEKEIEEEIEPENKKELEELLSEEEINLEKIEEISKTGKTSKEEAVKNKIKEQK